MMANSTKYFRASRACMTDYLASRCPRSVCTSQTVGLFMCISRAAAQVSYKAAQEVVINVDH
jgi:hypothetical protein